MKIGELDCIGGLDRGLPGGLIETGSLSDIILNSRGLEIARPEHRGELVKRLEPNTKRDLSIEIKNGSI